MLRKLAVRMFATIFALTCLFALAWYVGGKDIVENFVQNHTQPWAVFQVPENPTPLVGLDATIAGNTVTVCNRSNADWNRVLVQVDQGYLAALDRLRTGECRRIPVRDFVTESWKRMPPPRDFQVTRVAVLANVLQRGYAKKSLLDQGPASSQ